ncbi:MAG TPA: hypothetical protein VLL08_15030 [Kineosporiaceae bacterium]|nr:hypothetical protein [Kineosporiaceae bacterium]
MDDDQTQDEPRPPVMITCVVDCVGALATGSLHGNLHLFDTNGRRGSVGLGTEQLHTRVDEGDELLWTVMSMECEAHVAIDDVIVDPSVCVPEKHLFPHTGVPYWRATVLRPIDGLIPYQLSLGVGTRTVPMTTETSSPALAGGGAQ